MRNSAGKFIRYSKADWTFTSLDIPIPPVDGDWSRFNLTDLEGEKTYPIVTTTIIATDSDLTGRGMHCALSLCTCMGSPGANHHATASSMPSAGWRGWQIRSV